MNKVRLQDTPEMEQLWIIIEPYLLTSPRLSNDATQEVKEAYKKYLELDAERDKELLKLL